MLRWAAEDEYLARGEYAAIMQRFGTMRPYSNIMASEEQHLSWLRAEYQNRGLPFPADGSSAYIVIYPATLRRRLKPAWTRKSGILPCTKRSWLSPN
jgi:hypothetical protein